MNKLFEVEALSLQVAAWRQERQRVGFTCGAFDLLHAGHVDYLGKARELCDRLIVAVNSDDSIRRYKSPLRPIVPERQRIKLVSALSMVDAVVLMEDSRPLALIELLKPDLYFKGGDYQASALRSASAVEGYGGKTVLIPVTEEISSTKIVERISELALYASPEPVAGPAGRPIVFLDRDGTIIRDVPFLKDPRRVELLPGVGANLRRLQDAGYLLVVATNQQGIGLGYFDYDEFVEVNSEMLRQLAAFSVRIARFYFCPHSFADGCECRKPAAGLLRRALVDFQTRPDECFMIGDRVSDVEAAKNAGCHGFLVSQGSGTSFDAIVEHILSLKK